jgi:hypothetical protein
MLRHARACPGHPRFWGVVICFGNTKSPLDNYVNQKYIAISPRHCEGRFAIVTKRGAGCDGRLLRQVIFTGRNAAAYGEVVWSWRRDPGVYPCRPVLAWQR